MQQMSLAEEYNQQGRGLYGLDKYDEALDFFRKAEEKDPSYLRTYINKAELYITTHQLDKAKEELKLQSLYDFVVQNITPEQCGKEIKQIIKNKLK